MAAIRTTRLPGAKSAGAPRTILFVALAISIAWFVFAGTMPQQPTVSKDAALAAEGKFRQIQESSVTGQPFGSIRISESELNSYVRYGLEPEFPPGVSNVQLQLQPGRPQGTTQVDFDKLKGGMKSPPNPLIGYLLRGVHIIGVQGTLSASNGMGQFHLETVTLDGTVLPQPIVEFLIDQYLKSRYPNVAIDRPFALGFGIRKLEVQSGSVVLTSRSLSARNSPPASKSK